MYGMVNSTTLAPWAEKIPTAWLSSATMWASHMGSPTWTHWPS